MRLLSVSYDSNTKHLRSLFSEMQRTSIFSDDQFFDSFQKIVFLTRDYDGALDILRTSVALAETGITDLGGATDAVAKASMGFGMALGKMIPSLKDAKDPLTDLKNLLDSDGGLAGTFTQSAKRLTNAMDALKGTGGANINEMFGPIFREGARFFEAQKLAIEAQQKWLESPNNRKDLAFNPLKTGKALMGLLPGGIGDAWLDDIRNSQREANERAALSAAGRAKGMARAGAMQGPPAWGLLGESYGPPDPAIVEYMANYLMPPAGWGGGVNLQASMGGELGIHTPRSSRIRGGGVTGLLDSFDFSGYQDPSKFYDDSGDKKMHALSENVKEGMANALSQGLMLGFQRGGKAAVDYFGDMLKEALIRTMTEALAGQIVNGLSGGSLGFLGSFFGWAKG